MNILKRNIIANYFGQFYSILIGIIMVPFYLKYLGTEAYGLVGFFVLVQSWMALFDLGLSPTLSREVAKVRTSDTQNSRFEFILLLHSLEFVFIIFSFIMMIVIVLFSEFIAIKWLNVVTLDLDTVSYCIKLMGIMVGLNFMTALFQSGIKGAEAQVWLNLTNIILRTLQFVGVLLVLYFIDNDIKLFFEYQLIIIFITLIVFSFKFYKLMNIGRFKIYFAYKNIKPIVPFAMAIAYTGGLSIIATQLDKLLLSNVLVLKEFGFFTLVALVANAIMQFSGPIGQAIQPRMTSLLHQGKTEEMMKLYRQFTQYTAIIIFSIVGIVGFFSYELLYAWTGNKEASLWGKDILFWYAMGNGILAVAAFTYYLQFAYGKMKMLVQYNTIQAIIQLPFVVWAAYTYGAIGVAITWFIFRLISMLIWTPLVHHKFAPGIHKDWIFKDILPIFLGSILYLYCIDSIGLKFDGTRVEIFSILIGLGIGMLIVNMIISSEGRKLILKILGNKSVK